MKVLGVILAFCMIASLSACKDEQKTASQETMTPPAKDHILVGRVAPLSGPLASFGQGTPYIEEAAVEKLNAEGGIYIEEYGKKLPLKFVVVDSESNTTKASEAATKLITKDKVDVMIVSHTVDTVNPVSAASERYGVPCISVDAPVDAWLDGGPYQNSYHAFFNTKNELDCFIDAWDLTDSNKKVGLLAANDAEGMEIAGALKAVAGERGYEIVDPGRYTSGSSDYTSIIEELKDSGCDIIVGVMITPDFATFWKQCHQQGYVPKVCTIAKATLFEADVNAIGEGLGDGVISEVWWTPGHPFSSSLTGQSAAELGQVWTSKYGNSAPATVGYKHANVELLVDILTRAASLDPEKILAAAAATDLDTSVGHVKYDERHASVQALVTGQWIQQEDGSWKQEIIANTQMPNLPVTAKIKMIPGTTQK
jgi:branched-chain amino acid transport system substrate-binding protein